MFAFWLRAAPRSALLMLEVVRCCAIVTVGDFTEYSTGNIKAELEFEFTVPSVTSVLQSAFSGFYSAATNSNPNTMSTINATAVTIANDAAAAAVEDATPLTAASAEVEVCLLLACAYIFLLFFFPRALYLVRKIIETYYR